MPHPGYGFSRRSSSTLSKTKCWFAAYLSQVLEIDRQYDRGQGKEGPLFRGSLFHTLMEIHLMPEKYRLSDTPLNGTDGKPVLKTKEEAINYYLDVGGVSPDSVQDAVNAFTSYIRYYGNKDEEIKNNLIWKPEVDITADLSNLHPSLEGLGPIWYTAQYDGLAWTATRKVQSVEHKSAEVFNKNILGYYANSGQLIGQVALWNARHDLVKKYGRMDNVMLNMAFVNGKTPHRESVYVSRQVQYNFALAVFQLNRDLDAKIAGYEKNPKNVYKLFPRNGMVQGTCFGFGYSCDFIEGCHSGELSSDLYTITEPGMRKLERDKSVKLL